MASNTLNEIVRQSNLPNVSAEYAAKRDELRIAELEEMRHRERVAELRRHLPPGPPLQDYIFEEGPSDLKQGDTPIRKVRLTELFSAPDRSLIVYHLMYGKLQTNPCPMCTSFIDCINGIAHHLKPNLDVVIAAAAGPAILRAHARTRGWTRLRLLSCGDSTFKYDLASEDREGHQDSTISVITLDNDGTPRLFYNAHPSLAPDVRERGLDLLNPVWNFMDLTPQGRGSFYAKLEYACFTKE